MKHTKATAYYIMNELRRIGIKTKLIGSVESEGVSENDVDLVLLDYPTIDDRLVSKIHMVLNLSVIRYIITDWGGILIETPNYVMDLFPNSFMKKCYYCRKKCCLEK